ncbi:MAG: ABC transporter permease subunit [Armatimonadetes bacterium]|nr:ABC transporter permease subunit [Armatimonadota bacterium]
MSARIRIYRALARGVVLESLRRKDLWVVAILGLLIMLTSGVLGFFGTSGLQMFIKDLGVTVLGAFATILAILTSSRVLPDEIKQRTLYPLLSRPITRLDLLVGKFIGSVLVSWIAFLMLSVMMAVALVTFKVGFEPIMLQYLLAKMMGLAVVCAVSIAFSAFMTPAAASTLSFILAFCSSMIVRALTVGYAGADDVSKWGFKALNAVIPQFSLFDLGSRAANLNWGLVPMWVIGFLFCYMVLYCSAMMSLAWLKFRKAAL